jgi:dTDP-4-dehydrorhamnose reductase
MDILVFGETGQVARELAAYDGVTCLSRTAADLVDPEGCGAVIHAARPKAVINVAAYTDVDKAEEDAALATVINGETPGAMAHACADLCIPFVSVSTDYVFSGQGETPWSPSDPVAPLGAYGRSKFFGEQEIANAGGTWAILRTSWVVSSHGNNFVKTMLRLGAERDSLNIVADQIGGPTPARDVAAALIKIVHGLTRNPDKKGVYHLSGSPDVSWADFARCVFDQADLSCMVQDISSSAYPTPAARPLNSRLNCNSLEASFGITRPDWQQGLTEILKELKDTS